MSLVLGSPQAPAIVIEKSRNLFEAGDQQLQPFGTAKALRGTSNAIGALRDNLNRASKAVSNVVRIIGDAESLGS